MEFTMSINTNNNININAVTTTKQTYIDKFDKSLKLPFLSLLQNQLPLIKSVQGDEIKPDDSDFAVSDNVELSSAVTAASPAGSSDSGGTPGESGRNQE